jgi:hypothetical protein
MRAVKNTTNLRPGMSVRLVKGQNVKLPDGSSYEWTIFETIESIEGNIIKFQNFPEAPWFTTNLGWEIQK